MRLKKTLRGLERNEPLFAELKRRHVYRVAIAYGVVAWLLIQVATQVFPFFELSNFVVRVVVAASVLGFPVALIIAWAFEMTPKGSSAPTMLRLMTISPGGAHGSLRRWL
jgi:hypothetical protein